jgi:hypothetical protein
MSLPRWLERTLQWIFIVSIIFFTAPTPEEKDLKVEQVRAYTRRIEFDYLTWTFDALEVKWGEAALNTSDYLSLINQQQLVLQYIHIVTQIQMTEAQLSLIYSDPNLEEPEELAAPLREQLGELQNQQEQLAPVAEAILQEMVADVYHQYGFNFSGQPIPPVLYHSTPLPWALVVSPRDVIRQDANISLETDLDIEQQIALEAQVDQGLNVSSLVVPIGGVGVYPTMVAQTSNLNWLVEVISHEWMHNYLTLRPLGLLYESTPELRTMNETTANIAGKEIGAAVIERYFPQLAPPAVEDSGNGERQQPEAPAEDTPPPFDYRAEMHETRVKTDALLAAGKIEEAEEYMEQRRQFFWDNGYQIRKLNQAYFAFHGAYADEPLGAAGEDPVGAAVRLLRQQSSSLRDFVGAMAWLTSYDQLQKVLQANNSP